MHVLKDPSGVVLVGGDRQGIGVGFAQGLKVMFLVWLPGGGPKGLPKGCPLFLGTGAGHPELKVHAHLFQAGVAAQLSQTGMFTRAALLFSVSLVLPVLSRGGGQQDTASLDVISLALLCGPVWVCCFSHHPWSTAAVQRGKLSLQHWWGILQSAVPVNHPPFLAPENPFPADALRAGMWIFSLWSLYSNLVSLRFGLPWSMFLSSCLST